MPPRVFLTPLTVLVALLAALVLVPSPAHAEEGPAGTATTLSGTAAYAGQESPLSITVRTVEGEPVANAQVAVERRVDGAWQAHAQAVTDAAGVATGGAILRRDRTDNVFRASFAGDEAHAPSTSAHTTVPLLRRDSALRLSGPGEVVDEQSATLRFRWLTAGGEPVPGRVFLLKRKGSRWVKVRTLRTDGTGWGTTTVRPRKDTRWRVRGPRQDWVKRATSASHRLDNVPSGIPVRLPSGAPAPRVRLPEQRRAVGSGPNAVVSRIPNGIWRQMKGVTWHRGCPVGRAGLRLLRVNYWDYTGYRRRGEVVVNADAVGQVSRALAGMYHRNLPMRSMYRVDRFGWSSRLRGGDDYRSMAAGNTSGFNCRDVVGRPGVRSPHSWGRSIDINPWENPYRTGSSWLPNTWWVGRSHRRVAWRSTSHAVVSLMARHGIRWTYGTRDAHHFDAR